MPFLTFIGQQYIYNYPPPAQTLLGSTQCQPPLALQCHTDGTGTIALEKYVEVLMSQLLRVCVRRGGRAEELLEGATVELAVVVVR